MFKESKKLIGNRPQVFNGLRASLKSQAEGYLIEGPRKRGASFESTRKVVGPVLSSGPQENNGTSSRRRSAF